MSKPNSAARNTMSKLERQCYDWGFEDAEARIINLLIENSECALDGGHNKLGYCFCEAVELIRGESNE